METYCKRRRDNKHRERDIEKGREILREMREREREIDKTRDRDRRRFRERTTQDRHTNRTDRET